MGRIRLGSLSFLFKANRTTVPYGFRVKASESDWPVFRPARRGGPGRARRRARPPPDRTGLSHGPGPGWAGGDRARLSQCSQLICMSLKGAMLGEGARKEWKVRETLYLLVVVLSFSFPSPFLLP